MRKILKYGRQTIGTYSNVEEVLRDFGSDRVINHLQSSVGHSDRSILENESPRLLFCQGNFENGCQRARRVLTSKGLALGLNMPKPNEEHLELEYRTVRHFVETFLALSETV